MDPDPAIFVIGLQDVNKKLICFKKFIYLVLFEGTFTFTFTFFKDKKSKRSHKTVGIKVFLTNFCLMIEGSGSWAGSVPLTNGSGSRRPKTYGSDGSGSATLQQGVSVPEVWWSAPHRLVQVIPVQQHREPPVPNGLQISQIHLRLGSKVKYRATLRIRDVYPGSEFLPSRIQDPHQRILTQKKISKLSEIWSGLFILNPNPDFLPIPDPGVKKAPDPGSATPVPYRYWAVLGIEMSFESRSTRFYMTKIIERFDFDQTKKSTWFFLDLRRKITELQNKHQAKENMKLIQFSFWMAFWLS